MLGKRGALVASRVLQPLVLVAARAAHAGPATHKNGLPGDIPALRGKQEGNRAGDVSGRADPFDRNAVDHALALLAPDRVPIVEEVGGNRPGRNRIDRDAISRDLETKGTRNPDQSGLCRSVDRAPGLAQHCA